VCVTFVIPRTPIFGLEEVEPFPVPKTPSSTQEIPSTKIPLGRQQNNILSEGEVLNKQKAPKGKSRAAALPIDGVDWRWRSAGETRAGVVISDGLDDAGHHRAHHADHTCQRYRRNAPLDCQSGNTERVRGEKN